MEDLLIAVCKTLLKVGLLSSAHGGRQTDRAEEKERWCPEQSSESEKIAVFRLCYGYALKCKSCLTTRSYVNRGKVQASSCLLCVATGHVQTDTHLQLSHWRGFGVYLQRRHRAETRVTSLWKRSRKGLGIVVAVVTFLTAQLLRLRSQLPQLLCKSLIQS